MADLEHTAIERLQIASLVILEKHGLTQAGGDTLNDAVEILDEALDELMKEDKPNERR